MIEDTYKECTQTHGPCVYTITPRDDIILRFRPCCGKMDMLFRTSAGPVFAWDKQWTKVLEPEGDSYHKGLTNQGREKILADYIDGISFLTKQIASLR